MSEYTSNGLICKGVGGQYLVRLSSDGDHPLAGLSVTCAARGRFRHAGLTPLCGDHVRVLYTDASFTRADDGTVMVDPNRTDFVITDVMERKNTFIRPAMANLDSMIIVCSVSHPQTPLLTLDKLTAIAVHNDISPLILISKSDLDPDKARELSDLYRSLGFDTLAISLKDGTNREALEEALKTHLTGKISCLCGASGVGKSSLVNALFPHLNQKTGEISRKNRRGKNTTREITLFDLSDYGYANGWLADTPGFSMIDFEHFDFMKVDDLVHAFPEFEPYLYTCRYVDCAHVKEEGCTVLKAVQDGIIPRSRHDSYAALYAVLKEKKPWNTGS